MEFALLKNLLEYYFRQASDLIWAKLGLGLVVAALAPHQLALKGLALIFAVDFICGVWVAKKTHTLSSAGMRRGVAKLLIYFVFLGTVALAEHSIMDTTICTKVAIGMLLATEVLSITENLVMLGLPIPYASKVLKMVSNKAANYGITVDVNNPETMAATKDMVFMIETTIPAIHDKQLRTCMGIFISNWYQFMHELRPETLSGSKELVWERMHQSLDRVLIDIRSTMTRESVQPVALNTFLNVWCQPLLNSFFATCKQIAESEPTDVPTDRVDRIRDAMVLMLFRLVKTAQESELTGQLLKPLVP